MITVYASGLVISILVIMRISFPICSVVPYASVCSVCDYIPTHPATVINIALTTFTIS